MNVITNHSEIIFIALEHDSENDLTRPTEAESITINGQKVYDAN